MEEGRGGWVEDLKKKKNLILGLYIITNLSYSECVKSLIFLERRYRV